MSKIAFLVEGTPEGGVLARALRHSTYTESDTYDKLRDRVRDPVQCHFDDHDRPSVIRLHYVKDEVLAA